MSLLLAVIWPLQPLKIYMSLNHFEEAELAAPLLSIHWWNEVYHQH